MNIRDLQYLAALDEHCHFGKAAEACFVSQPALSMQIKKLEKYLNVQLLERTNKFVKLTEAGVSLAARAREILIQVAEMREFAKTIHDPFAGEIKLGIIPTLAPYLLPQLIPQLSTKYPNLKIFLIEEQTALLLQKLKKGAIDAAILALPISDSCFISRSLFDEEFMLAVSNTHSFSNRESIHQSDLEDKNLMLLEDGHCLRDQALSLCRTVGASEVTHFRATSLETLRHMVASGIGMTLMPKLACLPTANISYVAFCEPKPMRNIGLVWRASSTKARLFEDIAKVSDLMK
jgi:LysR family hydrogen peroxide-inducible transcriptional activator